MRRRRSIVVGVDGTESAHDALDWAAAEASARRLPLHVVHGYVTVPSWAGLGDVPQPFLNIDDAEAAASQALEQAVNRARCVASDVDVRGRLVPGAGATALLAQCGAAELIVLGSRGLGGVRGLLAGSVSFRVAAHATCPVVVVRPMQPVAPGRSATRVVVGVDGTPLSDRAIDFALRAATQRGVGLTAIHTWCPRAPADLEGVTDDWSLAEAAEWRVLRDVLGRYRQRIGTADIELRLVQGRAQDVLVAESAGAALVVVGSRGRGSVRAALLGSVSQAVLQHAGCPVAVIRSV